MNIQKYFPALWLLVAIGILHNIIGIFIGAYIDIWWWDILLHFLGGAWVALSGFWLFHYSGLFKSFPRTVAQFLFATLVPVIVIGGAWEVFEYIFGITFVLPGERYGVDTVGDIFVDLVGGLTVYLYYRLKYRRDFVTNFKL